MFQNRASAYLLGLLGTFLGSIPNRLLRLPRTVGLPLQQIIRNSIRGLYRNTRLYCNQKRFRSNDSGVATMALDGWRWKAVLRSRRHFEYFKSKLVFVQKLRQGQLLLLLQDSLYIIVLIQNIIIHVITLSEIFLMHNTYANWLDLVQFECRKTLKWFVQVCCCPAESCSACTQCVVLAV